MNVVTSEDHDSAEAMFEALRPRLRQSARFSDEFRVYRGIGDEGHRLIPTALRGMDKRDSNRQESDLVIFLEQRLLAEFVKACDRAGLPVAGDSEEMRLKLQCDDGPLKVPRLWPRKQHHALWAVAQHHGLPTRLLDWSRNPLIAAYFAASTALRIPCTCRKLAVWALSSDAVVEDRLEIVSIPTAHSPNLAAQQGIFTLTIDSSKRGERIMIEAVDQIVADHHRAREGLLVKHTLPRLEAPYLLELCALYGISGETMFPGLDGACRGVRERRAASDFVEWRISDEDPPLCRDPECPSRAAEPKPSS